MLDPVSPVDRSIDLTRLRALVLGNTPLTAQLASITDSDLFAARLAEIAATYGMAADEAAIRRAIQPDPLGLSRFTSAGTPQTGWPPADFLPAWAGGSDAGPVVDWAWFGQQPLTAPFFEGSIRVALQRPFNRLFRWRMSMADFVAAAVRQTNALMPDGFIFHMSRCGSTLVSQMLARSDRNIVISEAAPIDTAVQTNNAEVLRAMVMAFGRPRRHSEQRFFIKLDSWHALALPLFERAFPRTPWVFLFRDPLEVLVSQQREPGAQMVPQFVDPSIYGLDKAATPGLDYTARVLNRICTAAAEALSSPRGIAINYRDLPDAFEQRILPHFACAPGTAELEAIRAASRYDAKAPAMPFSADSAAKQAAASNQVRALARHHLSDVVRWLDAVAAAQTIREQSKTLL